MTASTMFSHSQGSLIAGYASRMGESLVRHRADIAIRAARIEADLAIKARSEFLANMNHELRTPLNAIIGFATMLRDGGEFNLDADQQREYSEYILQSADLLLGHINTILEVAALESGNIELNDDVIDLGDVLNDALERLTIRAKEASVDIERHDDGGLIEGWGDSERAAQAVDHLLQAAVKSCDEGGKILVRASIDEKGWPEIAIRDTGAGLTPAEISQALEAFNEVHRGLDRSFAGPGVGYAVAKTFIDMQGGRFSIKSRKGQGTLVRIALPPPETKHETQTEAQPTKHNIDLVGINAAQPQNSESVEKANDAA